MVLHEKAVLRLSVCDVPHHHNLFVYEVWCIWPH